MFKLIKYEFAKILNAVIGVLGAALVLEATYGIGALLMKFNTFDDFDGTYEEYLDSAQYVLHKVGSQMFTFSATLLVIAACSAVIFVIIFSITTMNNDFCKKQGYNVFLTPNSSYAILGAKYITSFIIFLLFGIIAVLLTVADINISLWLYDMDYLSLVDDIIKPILDVLDADELFSAFIGIVSQLIFYIFLAGFTLVFTHTVFKASGALKVVLQFVVFGIVNVFSTFVFAFVLGGYYNYSNNIRTGSFLYVSVLVYLSISAALYFITARLIEKKLSI